MNCYKQVTQITKMDFPRFWRPEGKAKESFGDSQGGPPLPLSQPPGSSMACAETSLLTSAPSKVSSPGVSQTDLAFGLTLT